MAILAIVLLFFTIVSAFPEGAPTKSCQDMRVIHSKGTIDKQEGPSPYQVTASRNSEDVIVTIDSSEKVPFEGFILQARSVDGQLAGIFEPISNDAQTLNCQKAGDTLTHINKVEKSKLEVRWKPMSYMGEVIFNATIAKGYATFWVGVESETFISDRPSQASPSTENKAALDVFYENCGVNKSCFGFPNGCVSKQSCKIVASIKATADANSCEYEMKALGSPAWVAVGLSDDILMGDDSVVECVKEGDQVKPFLSWNTPRPNLNTRRLSNPPPNVQLLNSSIIDDALYCRVFRSSITTANNTEVDLANTKYHLLIAAGSYTRDNSVGFHNMGQHSSLNKRYLWDMTNVDGVSNTLVKLHGACMLTAWIGTASIGIFIARYYRKTWTNVKINGKDVWFAGHYFLMILTCGLTVVGSIFIIAELQGWSKESNPHAILGSMATILCCLQPIGAFFRPLPGTENRPFFDWLHWLGGSLSYCCAIVAMFFASKLRKIGLPDSFNYILIAFVIFYGLFHLILTILKRLANNSSIDVTSFNLRQSGKLFASKDEKDSKFSRIRKLLLGLFVVIVAILTTLLIVTVIIT